MSQYVKICPKCKSLNIQIRWQSLWFMGMPAVYQCMKCKYKGYMFPEINISKLKNGRKKKK